MKKKINIMYFIPTFDPGGTEKIVLTLCNLLDSSRFKANVCVFKTGKYEKELQSGQRVFTLVKTNGPPKHLIRKSLDFIKRVQLLKKIIREESIDIIHTHHLEPFIHELLTLRKRRSLKWVHTEHQKMDVQIKYSKRMLNVCKYFLKFPDILTGVSNATSSYFCNNAKVPKNRIHTILNGIDVDMFSKLKKRTNIRKELNLPEKVQLVGIVGGLRREKNHKNLVCAFARAHNKLPLLHLVIVGDGECRKELERLVHDLKIADYVHFLGYRLDIPEIMSAIDVYCLSSLFEGMPLSIVEAWAARKPVVATDVIGIRELVRHEENGILAPCNNPEKLAEGLIKVLTDNKLREKIARNGQRFALDNCTVERMIEKYENLYLGLMNSVTKCK